VSQLYATFGMKGEEDSMCCIK